jgi:hypothetical protein
MFAVDEDIGHLTHFAHVHSRDGSYCVKWYRNIWKSQR